MQVLQQFGKQKEPLPGYTAHCADVKVTIKKGTLNLHLHQGMICAFALLSDKFKEKEFVKDEVTRNKVRDISNPDNIVVSKQRMQAVHV